MSFWAYGMARRVVRLAAFVFVFCVCASAQDGGAGGAAAGGAVSEQQTLREILSELRQLRGSIERTGLQTYKAQVTLGRIRIQQERVDRLTRQFDAARTELIGIRHVRESLAERARRMEEKVKAETDEEARAQWGNVLRDLQGELRLQTEKEQARGAAEAQMAAQIQTEQAALEGLNNQLELLERELEDAAPPGRKAPPRP